MITIQTPITEEPFPRFPKFAELGDREGDIAAHTFALNVNRWRIKFLKELRELYESFHRDYPGAWVDLVEKLGVLHSINDGRSYLDIKRMMVDLGGNLDYDSKDAR